MTAASNDKPIVKQLQPDAPIQWLLRGWSDLCRIGFASVLHGVIVTVVSLVILALTVFYWKLLPGAVSGFVLTGPFLATGLYALSKRLEKGKTVAFKDALTAWGLGSRCLFRFGLLLVLAASAWVLFSIVMFKFFIDATIDTPLDLLRYTLKQSEITFTLWTILGALGAGLAFSITVVSLPLLVERDVNMKVAILTSMEAVGNNPITMLWWAIIIMMLTGVSFLTGMLGFIVLYPLLGHASWHVYRDTVDASHLPLRPQAN